MEQQGWIQLYRKFIEWEWYTDTNTKSLFIHCLLKANHKDGKWKGKEVKRGQFITSYGNLAKETGLSVQNVRTSIKNLKLTGELTSESTSKLTKITVCNYATYNNLKDLDNKQTNNQLTSCQHTANILLTTNNNDNNKKNNKKIEDPTAYSNFCQSYPKPFNFNCPYTRSAFHEAVTIADGEDIILVSCNLFSEYHQAANTEQKYIPKAQDWLSDNLWRTDWMREKQKLSGKKALSTSAPSKIQPGEEF